MSVSKKSICLILILILIHVNCYEKTLRKIVRSQSKMVQRPFSDMSDTSSGRVKWRNMSYETSDALMFSGHSQVKKKLHKLQRPKFSSLSQIDKGTLAKPPYYNKKPIKTLSGSNSVQSELRLTRNIFKNVSIPLQRSVQNFNIFSDSNTLQHFNNKTYSEEIAIDNYYEIPQTKSTLSPMTKRPYDSNEEIIIIPNTSESKENNNSLVKAVFLSNPEMNVKPALNINPHNSGLDVSSDIENDRVDFLIQGKPVYAIPGSVFSYNVSMNTYTCMPIQVSKADIIAHEKFANLEIEPNWAQKKHYWNSIFDSRYEALMRNPKWPPLKVILVPRTHVDGIWKKTFERGHNETVHRIISNIVKKLQYYNNLTFTWNEVSHLSQWWKTATTKSRSTLRRLLRQGRLEIAAGGMVESDEATSHIFGLVHQMIEGQQWLKRNLNYVPQVAWLTNTITHSPTMAYLLAASGITNVILTNVHYSWEEFFAEYQYSDFIWIQDWENDNSSPTTLNKVLGKIGNDRFSKHAVFTHYLQFNSADFQACGPNRTVCLEFYNLAKASNKLDVLSYNIKQKAEILLEQYSKTGTITSQNTIIVPLGGAYHYGKQAEFDYQYNYLKKIADYINANREEYKATMEFGTAKNYFQNVLQTSKSYPTLRGDFINYADLLNGTPAYWTGYFTTRPWLKILLRRVQSSLRSSEILFSFALTSNVFQGFDVSDLYDRLIHAREFVARLQERHVVGGTLTSHTIKYIYKQILATIKSCWYIQEAAASLLSVKPNKIIQSPYLQKYVYREGEFVSLFKTVGSGDQVYVFNPLSHERTEIIELVVRNPNIRIIDHNKKDVTIQINPVWSYNPDNFVRISKLFYKILFAISVPPLTLELYRIKATSDSSLNVATVYCSACIVEDLPSEGPPFPFTIQPIQPGDIQLESYKFRLTFDEYTGFLKVVVEKSTGAEKQVVIDYGAFRSSDVNSGVFLFNTNVSKPLRDMLMAYRVGLKSKIVLISSGLVTTELTSVYGRLIQSTVKIYNLMNSPLSNVLYVESRVDYESSPKNRESELFMSIQTSIANGNPPEIFTDNNGFQYSARILNISRRVESNMYPMTTMSFIQDHRSRLTVITDHAQGVTALQEGQIVVMLDRRVLFNDGRGTNEGLSDSSVTCHRNFILLENFLDSGYSSSNYYLQLPSLSAVHLANSLDYQLEIFIIDKVKSGLCYYAFLPLVKTSFPCDVSLITYRVDIDSKALKNHHPSTTLMILHRQSVSCHIEYDVQLQCNGDVNFSLEKILNNIKSVYKTNLCGTNKGIPVTNLNQVNFPGMELATLRIYF